MSILLTCYAINPYKGSEDGTAWNMVCHIAEHQDIKVITRKNNQAAIERFMVTNENKALEQIDFQYYDLPYWMRFWKKGERGALLYVYLWQLFLPLFVLRSKLTFDIAHNLNFHSDWMPSFLWILGKPFVWGPIGHHPPIPKAVFDEVYGRKAYFKDRLKWLFKNLFWTFDPFLKTTKWKADYIFAVNSSVGEVLNLKEGTWEVLPAVGCKPAVLPKSRKEKNKDKFSLLSIGRFVDLKGFDLSIKSFAHFIMRLEENQRKKVELVLVGKGPEIERLKKMANDLGVAPYIRFVKWMERSDVMSLYHRSDAFLFPSHEGAGMVIPEALSFGLPIVCLDNYGPGEMIDESCGIKVKFINYQQCVEDLAKSLMDLYLDPSQRTALSKGARKQFEHKFTWSHKAQVMNSVYEKIIRKYETQNGMYSLAE